MDYNLTLVNETGEKFGQLKEDITGALDINTNYPHITLDVSGRTATITLINGSDGGDGNALNGNTVKVGEQYLRSCIEVYADLGTLLADMTFRPDPNTQ